MSGAFLASYLSFVNTGRFEFSFSIFILAMIVLGGLGSIWGAVVGAIVLSVTNTYLLPNVLNDLPGFNPAEVTSGIFGAILVIVMILRPQGLRPPRGAPQEHPAARRPTRRLPEWPRPRRASS